MVAVFLQKYIFYVSCQKKVASKSESTKYLFAYFTFENEFFRIII